MAEHRIPLSSLCHGDQVSIVRDGGDYIIEVTRLFADGLPVEFVTADDTSTDAVITVCEPHDG